MKHKISVIEFCSILYFTMRASFMGITSSSINFIAHQNSWISTIIGAILGIIPLILIIKIINYKPNLNIIDKNKYLFGNTLGNIINIILGIISFIFCVIVFYNLCIFISSQYLNKTPVLLVAILFGICLIYICSKGLTVLSRTSLFLLFIGIIFLSISAIGLIPKINIENLKPFINNGWSPIIKASFIYISYNIMPIIFLSIIPKNKINNSKNLNKGIIITYIIANFTLWNLSFSTIGTLGISLTNLFEYPEFHVLKYISFFGTSSRFDSIIFIYRIFDIIIFMSINLYFLNTIINSYIKKNKKAISYTIITILIIIVMKSIDNITNLNFIVRHIFSNIIFISTIVIILLITIKRKLKST